MRRERTRRSLLLRRISLPTLGLIEPGSLPRSFVEKDGGGCGGVQRFDAARHWDADARVGAALDFFGQAGTFVADKERNRLTPVHFPRREKRSGLAKLGRSVPSATLGIKLRPYGGSEILFVRARRERTDVRDAKLRKQNRQRHSCENGKMQRRAGGGPQRLWRERAGGAAVA